jgi:hypothetical protein
VTTITVYGAVEDVQRVRDIIEAAPGIKVHKASGPTAVADGSGRFRMYLSVEV